MERNYGAEIDSLQNELSEIKVLLQKLTSELKKEGSQKQSGHIYPVENKGQDIRLSEKMDELCVATNDDKSTRKVTYKGVFATGGWQSNWISDSVNTDDLLQLIKNHTAEKVLNCIVSSDRLNILLAFLRNPMTVAELVSQCNFNSTGQVYYHMKPLLAADLIIKNPRKEGSYYVKPHKVQGIIILLTGISDMVNTRFSSGNWKPEE